MISLQLKAYAKINWSIQISGKRNDGYHTLSSLMQKIDLADDISIDEWEYDCCIRDDKAVDRDLALSAWLLLKEKFALADNLRISIRKRIPEGGGLGGGSCDAAAVLNALNHELHLGLSLSELQEIGVQLGADVPFCLTDGLSLVEGIGEVVTPCPGTVCPLFLCGPGKPVSTVEVYRACDSLPGSCRKIDIDRMKEALRTGEYAQIPLLWGNDLMTAACHVEPELLKICSLFESAEIPYMLSGSGGTFFALANRDVAVFDNIRKQVPWSTFVSTMV